MTKKTKEVDSVEDKVRFIKGILQAKLKNVDSDLIESFPQYIRSSGDFQSILDGLKREVIEDENILDEDKARNFLESVEPPMTAWENIEKEEPGLASQLLEWEMKAKAYIICIIICRGLGLSKSQATLQNRKAHAEFLRIIDDKLKFITKGMTPQQKADLKTQFILQCFDPDKSPILKYDPQKSMFKTWLNSNLRFKKKDYFKKYNEDEKDRNNEYVLSLDQPTLSHEEESSTLIEYVESTYTPSQETQDLKTEILHVLNTSGHPLLNKKVTKKVDITWRQTLIVLVENDLLDAPKPQKTKGSFECQLLATKLAIPQEHFNAFKSSLYRNFQKILCEVFKPLQDYVSTGNNNEN